MLLYRQIRRRGALEGKGFPYSRHVPSPSLQMANVGATFHSEGFGEPHDSICIKHPRLNLPFQRKLLFCYPALAHIPLDWFLLY